MMHPFDVADLAMVLVLVCCIILQRQSKLVLTTRVISGHAARKIYFRIHQVRVKVVQSKG